MPGTAPAELQPLLHTWSLAVEEQFYLLFPGFLVLTWRLGIRVQVAILALAAVASLTLAQWLLPLQSATAFFLLPTRLYQDKTGLIRTTLQVSWRTRIEYSRA